MFRSIAAAINEIRVVKEHSEPTTPRQNIFPLPRQVKGNRPNSPEELGHCGIGFFNGVDALHAHTFTHLKTCCH